MIIPYLFMILMPSWIALSKESDVLFWLAVFAGILGEFMVNTMDVYLSQLQQARTIVTLGLGIYYLHRWKVYLAQLSMVQVMNQFVAIGMVILDWIRSLALACAREMGNQMTRVTVLATDSAVDCVAPDLVRRQWKGQREEPTKDMLIDQSWVGVGGVPMQTREEDFDGFTLVDCDK